MSLCIIGQEKSKTDIRLLEEAKKQFGSVFFVPIESIGIGLTDRFSIHYRTSDMQKFRAVMPRIPKNYLSYAYQLLSLFPQETYMTVKPISFLLASERFFLLTVLRKRGIATLNLHLARSSRAASSVLSDAKYPKIIRSPEKKTGVVVRNQKEARSVVDALIHLNQPTLIEDVVKDMVSVYVADPEVLAVVKKKTKETDVVFSKGEMKQAKISLDIEQLALDAAAAVDAHVARVDISLNGSPKVVNISLNPDLLTPSKVTGVNLPKRVMEIVHENYTKHNEKPVLIRFFEDAKSVVRDVLKTKQLL